MTNSKGYLRSLLTGDSGDWQKIVWNPNSKFSPTKYQLQGLGQVTRSLQLHFSSVKWHPPCRAEWGGTKAEKQEHGAWFLFLDEKERKKERKTTIAVLLITGPSDSDDSEMKQCPSEDSVSGQIQRILILRSQLKTIFQRFKDILYVNAALSIHLTLFFPHCVHKSVIYIHIPILALQISSLVPFF